MSQGLLTGREKSESRKLGVGGELLAKDLLESRGYTVHLLQVNYRTYDLEVDASTPFLVSVKTSKKQQHVRLGKLSSVSCLTEGNFVFAFMPAPELKEIVLAHSGYKLLIIPAAIARDDGIAVHNSYIEEKKLDRKYNYDVMVKGYAKRLHQQQVWEKWSQYNDAWSLLPLP
jgi:hypothetical protein